jgi:hypothetical protein
MKTRGKRDMSSNGSARLIALACGTAAIVALSLPFASAAAVVPSKANTARRRPTVCRLRL